MIILFLIAKDLIFTYLIDIYIYLATEREVIASYKIPIRVKQYVRR